MVLKAIWQWPHMTTLWFLIDAQQQITLALLLSSYAVIVKLLLIPFIIPVMLFYEIWFLINNNDEFFYQQNLVQRQTKARRQLIWGRWNQSNQIEAKRYDGTSQLACFSAPLPLPTLQMPSEPGLVKFKIFLLATHSEKFLFSWLSILRMWVRFKHVVVEVFGIPSQRVPLFQTQRVGPNVKALECKPIPSQDSAPSGRVDCTGKITQSNRNSSLERLTLLENLSFEILL